MASGINRDGPSGTIRALREAVGVPADQDNLPARVARHDDVLARHSSQLADHGDRLDRLEAGFSHDRDGR
jgi:hypothetical protein